jgi:hypothetical protein
MLAYFWRSGWIGTRRDRAGDGDAPPDAPG